MPNSVQRELDEAIERVLASKSRKKLVVAGPGAGKTTLFRKLLDSTAGATDQRLVLTFINNLKSDLDRSLGDTAQVFDKVEAAFKRSSKYDKNHGGDLRADHGAVARRGGSTSVYWSVSFPLRGGRLIEQYGQRASSRRFFGSVRRLRRSFARQLGHWKFERLSSDILDTWARFSCATFTTRHHKAENLRRRIGTESERSQPIWLVIFQDGDPRTKLEVPFFMPSGHTAVTFAWLELF
jgi:hypothetical protein